MQLKAWRLLHLFVAIWTKWNLHWKTNVSDFSSFLWLVRRVGFFANIFKKNLRWKSTGHHNTQHNDTQHNDTQHNDIKHNDIKHNDTRQNDIQDNKQ
jgi:hypothetical protein